MCFLFILGDDWEYEENFIDDDEVVGNEVEEREENDVFEFKVLK